MSANDIKALGIITNVIADALEDRKKRKQLIDDPKQVLTEAGLTVPPRVKIFVHENKRNEIHLVLPSPEVYELDLDSLDARTLARFWPY